MTPEETKALEEWREAVEEWADRGRSRRAVATRSLRLAERLTGRAREQALREHFAMVLPARSCPVRC